MPTPIGNAGVILCTYLFQNYKNDTQSQRSHIDCVSGRKRLNSVRHNEI